MENPAIVHDPTEQEQHTTAFRLGVKKRSDKLINYFLASYFLVGLIFAFFYDTWTIALGVGSLSIIAYYSVKIALPNSDLYQYVLSVVLGIFMAQYIYQMHGLFEMHFFAFIGSAILITYQNWKLQIPMLAVVIVHHVGFGYLQNSGVENVYFTQLDYFELGTFIIHFVLAAVIFFICGLWGYQLKKYSEIQIGQSLEMARLQQEALNAVNAQKEQLERHVAVLDKAVAQGKYEVASDVMHDIGNAVVGFGSYLTRIRRLQEQNDPENLQNLTGFFEEQKPAVAAAIGENKADAVIKMLGGIAETQKNNQEEINKSISEQIKTITHIQEILNIQRQHISGHENQERRPVNLRTVINDSLAMLFASIDKMAIAVSLNIAAEKPVIKGDRTRLMQVILNILKNSIEAIDANASEKNISLHIFEQADQLILQVKDTGNGFDKTIADQLFKRGFTTKLLGTGESLYNCRAIVESHEGSIDISSEGPGKGAIAMVSFKI
jgi:signal transduction histidine kinase